MMKQIIYLLVVVCSAASANIACHKVPEPDASGFFDLSETEMPSAPVTTVVLKKKTAVPHGKILTLERIGEMWRSVYSPDNKNHQGDPRYFIYAFGERIAQKFFFKLLSRTELETPNAELFNYAIQQANVYLKSLGLEEIGVGFYETSSDPIKGGLYSSKVKQKKYPVATDGHYLVHDIALHYGSILLPNILLEHAARKTEHLAEFFNRIKTVTNLENPEVRKKMQEVEDRIMELYSGHIDAFNGNTILVTVDRIHTGAIEDGYKSFVLDHIVGYSVANLIEMAWVTQMTMAIADMPYAQVNGRPILSEKDAARLYKTLNLVAANYVRTLPKDMKEGIQYSSADLEKFIDQRLAALKKWP